MKDGFSVLVSEGVGDRSGSLGGEGRDGVCPAASRISDNIPIMPHFVGLNIHNQSGSPFPLSSQMFGSSSRVDLFVIFFFLSFFLRKKGLCLSFGCP